MCCRIMRSLVLIGMLRVRGFRGIQRTYKSFWLSTRMHPFLACAHQSTSTYDVSSEPKRMKISKVFKSDMPNIVGKEIYVKGWVRTARVQKSLAFLEVNDGSSRVGLQAVCDPSIESFPITQQIHTGAAVSVRGIVVESPGQGQSVELKTLEIELVESCEGDYPLQKKRHSLEFLRKIAHLRPRTNTIAAIARVRSSLAFATHKYFQKEGFCYLQAPVITASDCEGAGEMFRVSSSNNSSKDCNFFGQEAFLSVSGQLSAEAYASAMSDVYTFGPTFRAENSQTTRHLAEFNMVEPEMSFCDLDSAMDQAEGFLKGVVAEMLALNPDDLDFFTKFYDNTLVPRLENLVLRPFPRLSYRDAVELLQAEIAKDESKWTYTQVEFGTDLHTEHERWLCEVWGKGSPTFVFNYPKEIKSFYMRDNDDGETVAAMDLLVPGVGELLGGSQREERHDKLIQKMNDKNLNIEHYKWYLDLRRYGSVPHSGYGIGFERLVCYLTATENIRDAIAFPRYPGHAEF